MALTDHGEPLWIERRRQRLHDRHVVLPGADEQHIALKFPTIREHDTLESMMVGDEVVNAALVNAFLRDWAVDLTDRSRETSA